MVEMNVTFNTLKVLVPSEYRHLEGCLYTISIQRECLWSLETCRIRKKPKHRPLNNMPIQCTCINSYTYVYNRDAKYIYFCCIMYKIYVIMHLPSYLQTLLLLHRVFPICPRTLHEINIPKWKFYPLFFRQLEKTNITYSKQNKKSWHIYSYGCFQK